MKKFKYLLITSFILLVSLFSINVKAEGFATITSATDFNNAALTLANNIEGNTKGLGIIEHFARSYNPPAENVETVDVGGSPYNVSIFLWIDKDTNTLYMYSSGETIFLPNMCTGMFANFTGLKEIDISNGDISDAKVMSTERMFYNNTSLTTFRGDSFMYNESALSMFEGCTSLKSVSFKDAPFTMGRLENMGKMFKNCSSLETIDISNYNTTNVTNMEELFRGCANLKSINFKPTEEAANYNLGTFSTGNVQFMNYMFDGCSSLESLDIKDWDTSSVIVIAEMFGGCSSLKELDLSGWNTPNLSMAFAAFAGCSNLETLDISNFSGTNVVGQFMFDGDNSLVTVFGSNNLTFSPDIVMFSGANNIVGGRGSSIQDIGENTSNYAHIDGGPSNPGYFTEKTYYLVKFMVDDTIFEAIQVLKYHHADLPNGTMPSKEGKTFSGWYRDQEFNTYFNIATEEILENTTLYAKFVDNVSVTLSEENFPGEITVIDGVHNNFDVLTNGAGLGSQISIKVVSMNDGYVLDYVNVKTVTGEYLVQHSTDEFTYIIVPAALVIEPVYHELPKVVIPEGEVNGTITITKGNGDPINPGDHIEPGTEIIIDVTADENYKLENVVIKDENGDVIATIGADELPYHHEITGIITIEPTIKELPTINIDGGTGSGEDNKGTTTITKPDGSEIDDGDHVPEGTKIVIEVNPIDGYEVIGVEIYDEEGNLLDTLEGEPPYEYIVNGPIVVKPIYRELPVINVGGGDTGEDDNKGTTTITGPDGNEIEPGSHVKPGTVITINVDPIDGYEVIGVEIVNPETGEVITTITGQPPYQYEVNGPIDVRPIYRELPVINIGGGDTGEDDKGTTTITGQDGNEIEPGSHVKPGTVIIINVDPIDGYEVIGVEIVNPETGEVITTITGQPPYQYEVNGPIDVRPIYVEKKVDITLPDNSDSNNNGTITLKDSNGNEITDGKIKQGDEITIEVTPKGGYEVEKVIIKDKDGNTIEVIDGSELPKKYKVDGPITIEAVYKSKYSITSGDNQTYVKGSKKDIVITCNGALEDLQSIEIDNGNVIEASNYKLESGSTILTLKSSFLEKTSNGEHTIIFNYKDGGNASAKLTVEEQAVVPNTGDNIILYVIMFIASINIIFTSSILLKRKYNN